jgi:hypothetical protein
MWIHQIVSRMYKLKPQIDTKQNLQLPKLDTNGIFHLNSAVAEILPC